MASQLQGQRAGLHFSCTLALSLLICTLLCYALLWEAGILIDTESKKLGFFTFWLRNKTAGDLTCHIHIDDLKGLGVAYPRVVLYGSVFVYCSLPMFLFVPFMLVFAWWDQCRPTCKLALGLTAIVYITLSVGLGTFLIFAGALIDVSELTYSFLALLLADALLPLQGFTTLLLLHSFRETDCPNVNV